MSHRPLNVGVRHRHLIPSLFSASGDSSPIPSWGGELIAPDMTGMEKLKELCALKQTNLQESLLSELSERDQAFSKVVLHFLVFACAGVSLCLSAHTSSDATLGNTLSLVTPILGTRFANGSHLSRLQPQVPIAPSVFGAGEISTVQKANAASINRAPLRFIEPVEGVSITSTFGNRIHPIFGDTRFHNGIDLGTPSGTPVKASRKGAVAFADWDGGYGKTIIIQHEAGYETLYAHLDEFLVRVGDQVAQGDVIGLSGSTGYVTGPHLHFEIRVDQVAHNPLDYLAL